MAGFNDQADGADDRDSTGQRDLTALVLVDDEAGADLASQHDRLGFARIEPRGEPEPVDGTAVDRRLHCQPRSLGEVCCTGTPTRDLNVNRWRDQDPGIQ